MYFLEQKEFGWNLLTASFICISVITTWQLFAFNAQAKKIWKTESAESASITQNTFRCFVTIASIWYGVVTHNLTITYTGMLTIPGLSIMRGLWKFGNPQTKDWLALILCTAGILLFLLPFDPAWVFAGFMIVGLIPIWDQIMLLLKTKRRGVNHGGMFLTFVVKNAALLIFAYKANEKVYKVLVPVYFVVTLWQFLLWLKYGKETETKPK